jgi:hypothetical protein
MNRNGHSPPANGDAAAASAIERKPRRRALRSQRFRAFRQPAIANDAGGEESLGALRAELLVLREENIRLKSRRHQRADIGGLLESARALPSADADADADADVADEAAQMLAHGLAIRQSLMALCDEMQYAMAAVASKLEALSPAEPTNGNGRGRRTASGSAGLASEDGDTN